MKRTFLDRWPGLVVSIAICFTASAIGALATSSSVTSWYPGLNKPSWNPPSWIFGPVWTLLYLMMAIAAWWVWRRRHETRVGTALTLFAVQLALNTGWSLVFFGLRRPDLAVIEIALLWIAIVATVVAFARISRPAAWMLAPYLAWVSFAALLNVTIWRLN